MSVKIPKVFITRRIPQIGIELLQQHFDVKINSQNVPISRNSLLSKVAHVDALLCMVTDTIDAPIIDAAQELKIISNHAVGYDNIDVNYASRKGIAVTNTPGVLTEATADLTWTLLLGIARHIVTGDRLVRSGEFKGWDPLLLLGSSIEGKTLGILGAGRIGKAVALRSRGWNMNVLYYSRRSCPELEKKVNARRVTLSELLQKSDFISIHLPLTEETHHLIGRLELQKMKPSAYLINTARGPIINEKALCEALKTGTIAGAALDVFENEPRVEPGLIELDNVILLPHIGSAAIETRNRMAEMAALNIIHFFKGKQPLSIVNPEVLNEQGIHSERLTSR